MVGTRLKVATDVSWLVVLLGLAILLAAAIFRISAYAWLGVGVVLVEASLGNWVIGDIDGIRFSGAPNRRKIPWCEIKHAAREKFYRLSGEPVQDSLHEEGKGPKVDSVGLWLRNGDVVQIKALKPSAARHWLSRGNLDEWVNFINETAERHGLN
jgi:hypothetical protein